MTAARKIIDGAAGAIAWAIVALAVAGNIGLWAAVIRYIETEGRVNVIDVTSPIIIVACMAASLITVIIVAYAMLRSTIRN